MKIKITRIGRRTAITRNSRGELNERGPAVLQKHVLFSLSSFLVFIVVVVVVVLMSLLFFHFCFFCSRAFSMMMMVFGNNERRRRERFFLIANSQNLNFFIRKNETYI